MVYLDTSILVSMALPDPRGKLASNILKSDPAYSSELCIVECQSGLSQYFASRASGLPAAEAALLKLLDRIRLVRLDRSVLEEARTLVRKYRIGVGLRSLDAIHIASCINMKQQGRPLSLTYLTADRRQHTAFQAEGFSGTLLP